MLKLSEQNRGLAFLAGTLVVGLLLTAVVMLIDDEGPGEVIIIDDTTETNRASLDNKIDNLNNQNFDPACYSTLTTEINASFQQKLINSKVKANLDNRLKETYSNLVYKKCELFLSGNLTGNSRDILTLLTQVETIGARNTQIDDYRSQIKFYEYYSKELPDKVQRFITGGTATFVEPTYLGYKSELDNMPGLDPKYKDTAIFKQIKSNLISKLNALYNLYSQPAPELETN